LRVLCDATDKLMENEGSRCGWPPVCGGDRRRCVVDAIDDKTSLLLFRFNPADNDDNSSGGG
jgi:hypothetical protein